MWDSCFRLCRTQARALAKKKNAAVRLLTRSYARLESAGSAAAPYARENPAVAAGAAGVVAIVLLALALRMLL